MFIDYELLAKAQEYYLKHGYTYIETPWLVSSATSSITAPPDVERYVVTKGSKVKEFVASGEQGFLYLALKGFLPCGDYMTITPCLRNDHFDFTHVKSFMKCELISFFTRKPEEDVIQALIAEISTTAQKFFRENGVQTIKIRQGQYQIDLETSDDVELGSYGYRSYEGLHWIYGTGLAEPRFSRVRNVLSHN